MSGIYQRPIAGPIETHLYVPATSLATGQRLQLSGAGFDLALDTRIRMAGGHNYLRDGADGKAYLPVPGRLSGNGRDVVII